jgi:hypothetical protein
MKSKFISNRTTNERYLLMRMLNAFSFIKI